MLCPHLRTAESTSLVAVAAFADAMAKEGAGSVGAIARTELLARGGELEELPGHDFNEFPVT